MVLFFWLSALDYSYIRILFVYYSYIIRVLFLQIKGVARPENQKHISKCRLMSYFIIKQNKNGAE